MRRLEGAWLNLQPLAGAWLNAAEKNVTSLRDSCAVMAAAAAHDVGCVRGALQDAFGALVNGRK
jgi:hypothetical protein